MAEPHDQSAAADRYAAIEAAYCDDRWQDVLSQGRQLLEDLGPADDALATALRQRLHLLMAHTHLHGLGDRDTAEDLYRQVLNTANAEPALRRSAEEGLQQCDQPTVRPAAETSEVHPPLAAPPPAAAPSPERPLPEPVAPPLAMDRAVPLQAAAAPWLEANPAPPAAAVPDEDRAPALMADVVEEPELLDVHRADPLRAEEIELELREPPSAAAAAAQALAASATVEAIAEVTAGLTGGRTDTDPSPGKPGPAILEGTAVAESLQAEPAIAEPPPVPSMEEDDDPDLLEGLLQVALG